MRYVAFGRVALGAGVVAVGLSWWGGAGAREDARVEKDARAPVAASAGPGRVAPDSVPFDLGAVMAQVHFAYRPAAEPGRFEAGHATYAVAVDAAGATFRPFAPAAGGATPGAPLRLEAVRVTRGERAIAGRAGAPRVERDGHLAIARGAVVEHYRNGTRGMEQSWELAAKPEGEGDLRVRVKATGLRYDRASDDGLHFEDAASGIGVRYGHGTFVDARGRETRVAARFVGGAIELVVPAAVVEAAAYPAVLDPIVSPEIDLQDAAEDAAAGPQQMPDIAWNGEVYLVAWHDEGNSVSGDYVNDLYGTRVTEDGEVLDVNGIAIAVAGAANRPSVASDGKDFFVTWSVQLTAVENDVYGTIVEADGTVANPDGVAIANTTTEEAMPSVASNGKDYLVVWEEYPSPNMNGLRDLYGMIVAGDGTVPDGGRFAIVTATGLQGSPSVASDGDGFLVAWSDGRAGVADDDVYGAIVDGDGNVAAPDGFPISEATSYQTAPDVTSNGTDYFVVWSDHRDGNNDVYGARVTSAGDVLDDEGIPIASGTNGESEPGVASDGTDYFVAWTVDDVDGSDIYGTRVTSDGDVDVPGGYAIATETNPAHGVRIASNGEDYLLAWTDYRHAPWHDGNDDFVWYIDVYGARVSGDGDVVDPDGLLLSVGTSTESSPSVASNGTDYLVVWQDYRAATSHDVYGVRVGANGVPVTPSGFAISSASERQRLPVVATNGTDYFVVWRDNRNGETEHDVYGARVTSSGEVLDPNGIALCVVPGWQDLPTVASNGAGYLVVWSDWRDDDADIYGAFVTGDGEVSHENGLGLVTAGADQAQPEVASNGSDYLLVWSDGRSGGGATAWDIYGTVVSAVGAVSHPSGFAIAAGASYENSAAVASGGTDYFVTWSDGRNGVDSDVYGVRVAAVGSVIGSEVAIATASGHQFRPAVVADGATYFVAWSDRRAGNPDIYGTLVRDDGSVDVPSGAAIADDPTLDEGTWFGTVALARRTSGELLLAYPRFVPEDRAFRVRARMLTYCPAGTYSDDGESACAACPDGTFAGAASTECVPFSECDDGEYESSPPSEVADRVCAPCTVCDAGTFEAAACTSVTDTVCGNCFACSAGTYPAIACAVDADDCAACDATCATCAGGGAEECASCGAGRTLVGAACLVIDGGACAGNGDCAGGACVDEGSGGSCRPIGGEASPCDDDGDCADGLACSGSGAPGECVAPSGGADAGPGDPDAGDRADAGDVGPMDGGTAGGACGCSVPGNGRGAGAPPIAATLLLAVVGVARVARRAKQS